MLHVRVVFFTWFLMCSAATTAGLAGQELPKPGSPDVVPAPSARAAPADGADDYRRAIALLNESSSAAGGSADEPIWTRLPELPGDHDPARAAFSTAEWRALVGQAPAALAAFEQGARRPVCRFGWKDASGLHTEFVDLWLDLHALACLTTARGWQRVDHGTAQGPGRAAAASAALADIETLLGYSHHLGEWPASTSVAMSPRYESWGLELLHAELARARGAAAEPLRELLEAHAKRRRALDAVVPHLRREIVGVVDKLLEEAARGDGSDAAIARDRNREVRSAMDPMIDRLLQPLSTSAGRARDEVRAELDDRLKALMAEVKRFKRRGENVDPADAPRAMALLFVTLGTPSLTSVVDAHERAEALLRECQRAAARAPVQQGPEVGAINGRVVDLRGEGVPVAEVWVGDADRALAVSRTHADGNGYFKLGRVPEGAWFVFATAAGRCVGRDYASSLADPVRIEVHDCAVIAGVLRNAQGAVVPEVVVSASPAGRALSRTPITATTDAEGRFTVPEVPLGLIQFTAWVPGEGLFELRHRVGGDGEVTLVASSAPTTSVHVAIEGLPETAAPEVELAWLPYRGGSLTYLPPPLQSPQILGGTWSAEGVPDWQYTVRLRAEGYAFDPDRVRLEEGQGPHRMTFTATKVGVVHLACPAVVKDGQGRPVAGVTMVLRRSNGGLRATATSDAEGKLMFASPLAAATPVVVYSTTPEWVIDQPKVGDMAGTHDRRFLEDHECEVDPKALLELRVVPATSVRGILRYAGDRPAAFTRVQLEEQVPTRWPQWMTFAYATTDREGHFHFRGLHHSDHPVRLVVEGAAGSALSEPFGIADVGTQATVPPLTLAPPSIVEGVVLDASGDPVPGATLWLRDWDLNTGRQRSGAVTETITDRQGRYRFTGVPPGGAWLQLVDDETAHQMERVVEPFEVEPGKTYEHDISQRD